MPCNNVKVLKQH